MPALSNPTAAQIKKAYGKNRAANEIGKLEIGGVWYTVPKTASTAATGTATTAASSALPADTTALPAGVTSGGGTAGSQVPTTGNAGTGTTASGGTSGGPANTTASTTVPDNATQA